MKKLVLAVGAISAGLAFAETTPTIRYFDDGGEVMPVEDTVTLGSGGKIVYSGDVTLEPVVNATEDLSIESDEVVERVYDGDIFPPSAATAVTIFENMNIEEWEPTYTDFDRNDHPQVTNIKGDGFARYVRRYTDKDGNPYLTAQMQNAGGGGVVLIYLVQSGNDVKGYAYFARYSGQSPKPNTFPDYENASERGNGWTVATATSTGYNVNYLVMRRVAKPKTLTVTKAVTVGSSLAIASSAHVVAQGEEAFVSGSTAFDGAKTIDGMLEIDGRVFTTLSGTFSGRMGKVVVNPWKDMAEVPTCVVDAVDIDYETLTTTWKTLKENARVSDVVAITPKTLLCYGETVAANAYYFKNDGETASAVAQEGTPGVTTSARAARIVVRHNGANVEIRADLAWYGAPTGYDYENDPEKIAKSWNVASYQPVGWSVTFATPTHVRVDLSAAMGGMLYGDVDIVGDADKETLVMFKNREVPTNLGTTKFGPHVEVRTTSGWDYFTTLTRGYTLYWYGKSVFKTTTNNQFNKRNDSYCIFDDSEVQVGGIWGYRNNVTFRNGARMTNLVNTAPTCSIGYTSNGEWGVDGEGVSVYDGQSITLLGGTKSDGYPWTLKVLDTTGDAAADFIINADISLNSDFPYHHTYKKGDGTVQINGSYTDNANPLHLQGGTWKAGVTDSFKAETPIDIDFGGGNLAFAADTANVLGTAILNQDAAIALEAGAEASFADSSAVAWTEDAKLTVTLGEGAKLRFGTSASALTAGQLAQIKVNDRKAVIDEEGFVGPKPKLGIAIIVR